MSDDEAAFLRNICDHPDADLPRLVFADYLEENGEAERAAFIRWQCDRSTRIKLDGGRMKIPKFNEHFYGVGVPSDYGRPGTLLNLLGYYHPTETFMLCKLNPLESHECRYCVVVHSRTVKTMVAWSRGLPVAVYASAYSLRGRAAEVMTRLPIRAVVEDQMYQHEEVSDSVVKLCNRIPTVKGVVRHRCTHAGAFVQYLHAAGVLR